MGIPISDTVMWWYSTPLATKWDKPIMKLINDNYKKEEGKSFRYFLALLFCFIYLTSYGQTMSIASFKMDETDQTANLQNTMREDVNGDKCALIKIITTQRNFTFDVGLLGITETEWQNSEHPGEIWLYVPHGVNKISIQHPQFSPITKYELGERLKKGRTYVMELTSDQVNTFVVDFENEQDLDITVSPHNADVYINGLKQNLDFNGQTSIKLPFGTHNYRIVADNYHPEESQIIINDKENRQNLTVQLKQAFGYVNIEATPESKGGELFIDDSHAGTLPIAHIPLKSGVHDLAVYQKLYFPFRQKVTMTDNDTITITPRLTPNYSEYEIIVDDDKDAEIYDNGELLGIGDWKGRLEARDHTLEAKKPNHTTTTQKITVVKNTPRKVALSNPTPIYGTLEIKTQPTQAQVFIDGNPKAAGATDFIDRRILIGSHHIKIVLPGHKTEEFDVDIKEGQTEYISKRLTDYSDAIIYSAPIANVSIDGIEEGETPLHINRVAGNYQVSLSAPGYTTVSKKMRFDGNSPDSIMFRLYRDFTRPTEIYFMAGCNVGKLLALNFGIGGFLYNVNIEANYFTGLSHSEVIYWSDQSGESVPFTTTYKPSGAKIKLGYGIKLHSRIRLTPQVGCQFLKLKETIEEYSEAEKYSQLVNRYESAANGANAISLCGGLRFNLALTQCLALSFTPEYLFSVSQSDGFKALADVSNKVKNWAEGFNCNVSLNIFF